MALGGQCVNLTPPCYDFACGGLEDHQFKTEPANNLQYESMSFLQGVTQEAFFDKVFAEKENLSQYP